MLGGDLRSACMSELDFQPYLKFVRQHYGVAQSFYTPTDAILPLQVRSVVKDDREERGSNQKIEQFPVLVGLRQYAIGEKREHVLLAGRPGSGKSTALRQLVVELVADGLVPVLVQLKGDRAVPELIKAEFRRAKIKVTDEQIEDWLLADRLVLLLDGVNEIPHDDLRRSLAQLREDNPSVPMVFTTRDLSLGGDLGIEKRFEMQPLSETQLREFVGKYLPEQGEQLLGQLRDRLQEIAETPLLLKMLCDVFHQTGEVPQNKGELFRGFDREYEKFKGLPAVSADFRRFKSEILQYLAFVMMQGDSRTEFWLTIDRGRAERLIEAWLMERVSDPAGKAKEWLEDLLEHHLLQVAVEAGKIEFHHQLFQEYYAAEWLLDRVREMDDETLDCEFLNLLKWTETVGLMLGLVEDEGVAVRVVERSLGVDWMLGARLVCGTKYQGIGVSQIRKLSIPKSIQNEILEIVHFSETATEQELDHLDDNLQVDGTLDDQLYYEIWANRNKGGYKLSLSVLNETQENRREGLRSLLTHQDFFGYEGILEGLKNAPLEFLPQIQYLLHETEQVELLMVIQGIQSNCKFYNYEIHQKALARHSPGEQQLTPANPIYQFPNATEVKIIEHIDNYHESPPRDPPP
jgi:hypothetical protein